MPLPWRARLKSCIRRLTPVHGRCSGTENGRVCDPLLDDGSCQEKRRAPRAVEFQECTGAAVPSWQPCRATALRCAEGHADEQHIGRWSPGHSQVSSGRRVDQVEDVAAFSSGFLCLKSGSAVGGFRIIGLLPGAMYDSFCTGLGGMWKVRMWPGRRRGREGEGLGEGRLTVQPSSSNFFRRRAALLLARRT